MDENRHAQGSEIKNSESRDYQLKVMYTQSKSQSMSLKREEAPRVSAINIDSKSNLFLSNKLVRGKSGCQSVI